MKDRHLLRCLSILLIMVLGLFLNNCSDTLPEESPGINGSEIEDGQEGLESLPSLSGDEIEVVDSNLVQDMFGSWVFSALIKNTADYPVGNLKAELECMDSTETVIYSGSLTETQSELPPMGTMPVQTSMTEASGMIDQCEFNVSQLFQLETETASVEIQGLKLTKHSSGVTQISGKIQNSTQAPVLLQSIRSALYVNDELFVVLECDVCPSYLREGERGAFRHSFFGTLPGSIEVGDVETFVAAQSFIVLEGLEVLVDVDKVAFMDNFHTYHILGSVQNQLEESLNITLHGALYDQQGRVLDAATTEVVPHTIGPGMVGFYDLRFGGPHTDALDPDMITEMEVRVERLRSQRLSDPIDIVPLNLIETEASINNSSGIFIGQVINETEVAVSYVEVVIAVLDPSSTKIIGLGHHTLNVGLLPGEAEEFQIQMELDPVYGDQEFEFFSSVQGIRSDAE